MTMSLDEVNRTLIAQGAPFEMIEQEVFGQRLRCWKNVPPTARALVETLPKWGVRDYLVYEGERFTYAETYRRVCALATWLVQTAEVRKGDRIAIAMRNYPEWPVCFWAASSIGAIVVPLNAWWTGEELAYGLRDSGTRVVFADAERVERIAPHADLLGVEKMVAVRTEHPPTAGWLDFAEVLASSRAATELPPVDIAPDDNATIFYTSGTTGDPKGALGTHRNLVTNIGCSNFGRARARLRKGLGLPPPDAPQQAVLLSVPLFHVTGCHSNLVVGTYNGAKIVTMRRWNPERALELFERERIDRFGGVPSMAWQVIESPDFAKRDTSSIKSIAYGGAPSAPELVRRLQDAFPDAMPSNGYGLTETSALATNNTGIDYTRKPESCGPPLPICDAKVVDEAGDDLGTNAAGELWLRGPNVVRGYWNKPEATRESFVDGWLHTGDIASIDDEGFITILDRAKDMLIRGGENIYCVEVESVLYAYPGVMDAAVIGLPHRVLGEEVGAVVQVAPRNHVDPQALQEHAAKHLAAFKVPIRIVQQSEPLPRNANGKIMKHQLKHKLGVS